MKMGKNYKELSRRDFLELAAAGAAGVAVSGLGIPSALGKKTNTQKPHIINIPLFRSAPP